MEPVSRTSLLVSLALTTMFRVRHSSKASWTPSELVNSPALLNAVTEYQLSILAASLVSQLEVPM
jgi:hypothetical protein